MGSSYPITDRNKVKRVPQRGNYDKETLYRILDAGFLCHLSFVLNDQPFIIPTLYGREDDKVYVHGATTSRMLVNLQKGIPVSLAVTHVDGLVLARSIFHHSANYRSAVVFGTAKLTPEENKEHALFIVSENIIKGRWDEVRTPNKKELKATSVLEINIDQASSKIRTGPPKDEPEDYELDVWAGVIPFETVMKTPVEDPDLKAGLNPSDVVTKYSY
ncbi:MAG: pyridoxamine 5'-phosphate oxidase family protein [Cyclobacteriaceae bacterium]